VGALACASVLALAPVPAQAVSASPAPAQARGLPVSGHVTCAGGQHVEGVFVASSGGGSGYAGWWGTSRSTAYYHDLLETTLPTAISLHVGCGGTPAAWGSNDWTPEVAMVTKPATIDATGCKGSYCTFRVADRAAAWAEGHLTVRGGGNKALSKDEVTDNRAYTSWAGLGVAFAFSAYLNAAHSGPRPSLQGPAATPGAVFKLYAEDHLVQGTWETSTGGNPLPPRGALVFYQSSAVIGQLAISAGNGQVISANSQGSPLVREQAYTSIPGYLGWAFPANMVAAALPTTVSPSPSPPAATAPAHQPTPTAAPSIAPHPSWVKYYIVPPPHNGHKEYLFEIAAKTLGNGNRYKEIFNLNKGRLQPGGARLENPAVIAPGWILILPSDAHGPGVHYGPLPSPHPAGQPSTSGAVSRWLLRVLEGCLVLLMIFGILFTVRRLRAAWRRRRGGPRQPGPPPRAGGPARGHDPGGPPAADRSAGQPADRSTGQAISAPRLAGGGVTPLPRRAPSLPARGQPKLPMAPPLPPAAGTDDHLVTAAEPEFAAPRQPELATIGRGDPGGQATGAGAPPATGAAGAGARAGRLGDTGRPDFSPAALRLLGLRETPADDLGGVVRRHEVLLGSCQVEAVLAEAPARGGKSGDRGWVTSDPYLVWTPLPHDVPDGGIAFACVGAGKGGCLFIDLAAAPGAVALGGERQAAARLAESLAYQLCTGPAAGRVRLVVVGDAVPLPAPPGAEWIASTAQLAPRIMLGPGRDVELVFCRLSSDADVFPLARYAGGSPYRVIPVVLADLPGAPWSFTAHPSQRPARVLQPVVS
jgi:hypothetical protein